jgi:hypothetical protein
MGRHDMPRSLISLLLLDWAGLGQGCSSLSAPWISATHRVGHLSMGMEDSLQSESLVGSRQATNLSGQPRSP